MALVEHNKVGILKRLEGKPPGKYVEVHLDVHGSRFGLWRVKRSMLRMVDVTNAVGDIANWGQDMGITTFEGKCLNEHCQWSRWPLLHRCLNLVIHGQARAVHYLIENGGRFQ